MNNNWYKWMDMYEERGIPIAVPDGHLEGVLRIIFGGMNLEYPTSDSGKSYAITTEYTFEDGEKQKVYVSMHRPKGIVELTRDGYFVAGISGKDWWFSALPIPLNGDSEQSFIDGLKSHGLYKVADLGYRPSSVVVVVPKSSEIRNLRHFIDTYSNGHPLENIGSELVGLSTSLIEKYGIKVSGRLIESSGKTEGLIRDGIADAIVEIGETGCSVEENDGKILTPFLIRKTTPHCVARLDALKVEPVKKFLRDFKGRLGEVMQEMKADPEYGGNFQEHLLLKKLDSNSIYDD